MSSYHNIFVPSTFFFLATVAFNCDHAKHIGANTMDKNSNISFAGTDQALLDKRVNVFVHNYIQTNKECLYDVKQRSQTPFDLIDSVLNHYHLPIQLKYLAVIESELKTSAVSEMGAVGPWQLMPATAHIFGLKISKGYDERRNYRKSTRAAAEYLKDLHAEFGDWLLVLAAYNAGEGPIYSAMRQSESRNYWILQRYLPFETREYVKKFMATYYYFEGQEAKS